MSSSVLTPPWIVAMPRMYSVSGAPPKSGVGSSSAASWTTSSTASTMAPIRMLAAEGADLDNDNAGPFAVALGGEPELGPEVENGMTLPRRLMTPLMRRASGVPA